MTPDMKLKHVLDKVVQPIQLSVEMSVIALCMEVWVQQMATLLASCRMTLSVAVLGLGSPGKLHDRLEPTLGTPHTIAEPKCCLKLSLAL
eukprot:4649918-Amphidinium_carterae.1